MSERIELGCPGHFIAAGSCGWRRHTRVGDYSISSVGDYYPPPLGNEKERRRETIGCNRYFETMVFRLKPGSQREHAEGCGCGVVEDWSGIDFDGYQTAGEAQAGHERMVEKYLAIAEKGAKS